MIHFLCPRCNTAQQVADSFAGTKLPCSACGQRLQVPLPPQQQTMQGVLPSSLSAPAPAAGKEWHYTHKGQTYGPVREADLKALVAQGKLRPRDKVWCDGMGDWQEAEAVLPRLFA